MCVHTFPLSNKPQQRAPVTSSWFVTVLWIARQFSGSDHHASHKNSPSTSSCTDKPASVVTHPAVTRPTCLHPERKHLKLFLLTCLQPEGQQLLCSLALQHRAASARDGREPQQHGRFSPGALVYLPPLEAVFPKLFIDRALACQVAKGTSWLPKVRAEHAH